MAIGVIACAGDKTEPMTIGDIRQSLNNGQTLSRRAWMTQSMGAAGVMPLLAAAAPLGPASAAEPAPGRAANFDWQDPADNLRMHSRRWGTLEEGEEA